MNTLYVGRHRTASFVDLTIPKITVENISACMIRDTTLYVSLVDATTHNMLGIDFGPDAIDALWDAMGVSS